ncbi:MAG: VPLPA-CTERM sorting domain-containing protein [Roseinatronobacter sp.]
MALSKFFSKLAAAGVAALLSTGTAWAANCDVANFTNSTACVAPVAGGSGGNVTVAEMNAGSGVFSITSWDSLAKADEDGKSPTEKTTVDGVTTWDAGLFTVTTTATPNLFAWALNALYTWDQSKEYAFAIKGGAPQSAGVFYNAVYLMDKTTTSGFFKDDLTGIAIVKDWSNLTLFGTGELVAIPLPAAGWLLISVFGGLGLANHMRRKRSSA